MTLAALGFLLGDFLFQQLASLPSRYWLAPVAGVALLVWLPRWRVIGWLALGFGWAWIYADGILQQRVAPDWEGQDVIVEGRVTSIPKNSERGQRFLFAIEKLWWEGAERTAPQLAQLASYTAGVSAGVSIGERWRLQVRLKQPHGFQNPGGFDYEGWLFSAGIRAVGYVREGGNHAYLGAAKGSAASLGRLREAVARAIERCLEDRPYAGMIEALVVGERQSMSAQQWDVLIATGTNHLMAISGLHVSMVALVAFWLFRHGWSALPRLALWAPAPRAAAVAGLAAAVAYSALAGFSVPTQRSMLMVAVVMGGLLCGRQTLPVNTLAVALIAVLAWNPVSLLAPGFWLSFGAVALIFFAMHGRISSGNLWWRWGRVHAVMAVGLAPILLLYFGTVSLSAPLANFVAVPWVTFMVVPLALVGALVIFPLPAVGAAFLQAAEGLLDLLFDILEPMAAWSWGQWTAPQLPLWALAAASVGCALLLAPRGMPGRSLGAVLWLPALLWAPPRPAAGELWLTLLDVGQGLAVVAQTQHHTLVYDTGPRFSADFDTGQAVVLPFLRQAGIRQIDTLVIGHGDNDHRGGAESVLNALPVKRLLTSLPEHFADFSPANCVQGQRWEWDGVTFEVLSPQRTDTQGNNSSCVLRIDVSEHAVLLPGDIERAAEARLVARFGARLRADVLIAPHHGSMTSSTQSFVSAVQPRYVLFPVGYRNRYGFPKPIVVDRYQRFGPLLLDSARHGAVGIILDQHGVRSHYSFREQSRHYWHWRESID